MIETDIIRVTYSKYSFKPKRPRLNTESDDYLEESVQTISVLLSQADAQREAPPVAMNVPPVPAPIPPLSAEVAAALAQRRLQAYEDEDEGDESSGPEFGMADGIRPNTSDIRGDHRRSPSVDDDRASGGGSEPVVHILEDVEGEDDEVDVDEFPIPLRTRKGKEPVGVVGVKRKRA